MKQQKVSEERIYQIIEKPLISEKSSMVADQNRQVVFQVRKDANKAEVKQAVEALFNVTVESVQMLNVKGKVKRFGRAEGRRSDWKKAYVSLQEGSDIDFMGAAGA